MAAPRVRWACALRAASARKQMQTLPQHRLCTARSRETAATAWLLTVSKYFPQPRPCSSEAKQIALKVSPRSLARKYNTESHKPHCPKVPRSWKGDPEPMLGLLRYVGMSGLHLLSLNLFPDITKTGSREGSAGLAGFPSTGQAEQSASCLNLGAP